ncbi:hypothetical protein PIB30_057011 [Stylosanthes scabra]|uniref:Uncharacterized protein n=1 Tax=Stylosanthes scabra TaxID=79078 RepID=A0ABU6YIE0_9FABA|nr:hypothetical protein [Stylosanthes scabra]
MIICIKKKNHTMPLIVYLIQSKPKKCIEGHNEIERVISQASDLPKEHIFSSSIRSEQQTICSFFQPFLSCGGGIIIWPCHHHYHHHVATSLKQILDLGPKW